MALDDEVLLDAAVGFAPLEAAKREATASRGISSPYVISMVRV